jgi:hypothetical protein
MRFGQGSSILIKSAMKRSLLGVKQSFDLDLDLERRKKVFEMKASQYEAYFRHIDAIHNQHQTDYQDVFLPIMNEFMFYVVLFGGVIKR